MPRVDIDLSHFPEPEPPTAEQIAAERAYNQELLDRLIKIMADLYDVTQHNGPPQPEIRMGQMYSALAPWIAIVAWDVHHRYGVAGNA